MEKSEDVVQRREEVVNFLTERLPPEQVKEVRSLLARYFLEKAEEDFEKLAAEKEWNTETYKGWLEEHHRVPYK